MKSEEEEERLNMTQEELQQWVRARVEKDEQLVQRRAQLAQVEDWVKRKEREATYTQLLYNNACESVLECESVMKGLYGMLGLEYRDTDSEEEEEEGGGGGGGKPTENVIQITDSDLNNGEDEHNGDGDEEDEYVVIDLGAAVPETELMTDQKEVDGSSERSVQTLAQKVKSSDTLDPPTKVKPSSSSSSSIRKKRPPAEPLSTANTTGSPVPTTALSPCELSTQCLTPKKEPSKASIPGNEIVSNTSTSDTDRLETLTTANAETRPKTHLVASTQTPASKSISMSKSLKTVSKNKNSEASVRNPGNEKVKQTIRKSTSKPSGAAAASGTEVQAEKPKSVNSKQGDKSESKSSSSGSDSGSTDTSTPDKTSKHAPSTKPPDAKEVSQTSAVLPVTPSAPPARVQQEVQLKVNMSVLGRRRTKTWYQGTVLDIKSTESGPRYKILFDGGKGKSVVSAHHLACVGPPMLKDLFVGCRVVASYKEDAQSWLHAAVVAEMPDRKNRMRFLVFFDDGRSAYMALPDLHLVCKPLSNMTEDIEDEMWRAEVQEYLQTYPNPIFVVMRVGQESNVELDGKMELCTIIQVDGSLIQICYKKDQKTEWLFKGSNRLEQIQKIKKRMEEQKKEQAVNKAGWIVTQKNTRVPITTTTSTTNSTTVTSSTTTTTNITPSNSAGVSQTLPPATTSSSTTQTFPGKSVSQPRVVLTRVTVPPPLKTTTHTETPETVSSNSGTKRPSPPPEEEDGRSQDALLPVVGPRLKYVPHRCCPACLNDVRPMQKDQHRGQNPLLIPLLHGFRRMTARRRRDRKMSFHVFYRAPCGRSLCEMEEVQAFLFESRCDFLFLEMFCLDPFVLVKRALLPSSMISRPCLLLPDISEGAESVPVRCVNELCAVPPPTLTYTRHRVPAPGVIINSSLDFMVGCDCTDGCRDRSKCACHQMTIEATALFSDGPVDVSAGYTHKRLPRYVPTGVYECNSLCRCDPMLCGNRLVQHGLQLRLEVFMTQHKGWGLRCLDDVSKGTFVCVFTGKIVKDEAVSGESTMSGNEYLANLDYIEGVEKLKEGYESEAYSSDKEDESDKKTRVTMTTGALKKRDVFLIDLSSSSSKDIPKTSVTARRRERDTSDADSGDDVEDVEFKICSTDCTGAEWKSVNDDFNRSYTTRRNPQTPDEKESHSVGQTLAKIPEEQAEVTASMAKKMRQEGPGGPRTGFARKSTRAFAIKSSHRRVKPQAAPESSSSAGTQTARSRRCTRYLFDSEKACYLIDAKQEGNLARYINHSCSPNLFVQNVFVDTHDLRFPWVAFFTSKRIRAGTELTWDYSYEVGSVEGKVLLCCCGSSECTGRLL